MEEAKQALIYEALTTLKKWNPSWRPASILTDVSAEDVNAVQQAFPGNFQVLGATLALRCLKNSQLFHLLGPNYCGIDSKVNDRGPRTLMPLTESPKHCLTMFKRSFN